MKIIKENYYPYYAFLWISASYLIVALGDLNEGKYLLAAANGLGIVFIIIAVIFWRKAERSKENLKAWITRKERVYEVQGMIKLHGQIIKGLNEDEIAEYIALSNLPAAKKLTQKVFDIDLSSSFFSTTSD